MHERAAERQVDAVHRPGSSSVPGRGDGLTWADRRRRRRLVDELLRHADAHPDTTLADLPASDLPGPEAVWLALQDRWLTLLTARLGSTLAHDDADQVDAVLAAWRDVAAAHPTLRRLLDTPDDSRLDTAAVRSAAHREARLLAASAGLSDLAEHPAVRTGIGTALHHLARRPALAANPR